MAIKQESMLPGKANSHSPENEILIAAEKYRKVVKSATNAVHGQRGTCHEGDPRWRDW